MPDKIKGLFNLLHFLHAFPKRGGEDRKRRFMQILPIPGFDQIADAIPAQFLLPIEINFVFCYRTKIDTPVDKVNSLYPVLRLYLSPGLLVNIVIPFVWRDHRIVWNPEGITCLSSPTATRDRYVFAAAIAV